MKARDIESGLTVERLRLLLDYNPETGYFIWKVTKGGRAQSGSRAGTKRSDGYIHIGIDGRALLSHRLAWLYMTGKWPKNEIDYINRKRSDNRFCNLREATHGENIFNRATYAKSGLRGAFQHRSKWCSKIVIKGKKIHLGVYDTKEEAHDAYVKKARELRGDFCRTMENEWKSERNTL